jgi:hypothetical protein
MNALAMTAVGGVAVAVITLSGCAAIHGTRPGDMTVPEHEAAAKQDGQSADGAVLAPLVNRGATSGYVVAAQRRQLAKEHAKAADLRRAEVAAACAGVEHPASLGDVRVERVTAIRERDPRALVGARGYYPERLKGARVEIAAAPDEAPSVARAISCDAARESAGLVNDGSPASPFALRTAAVASVPASSRVIVEIRSPNEDDAAQILARSKAFAGAARRAR